MSTNLPTVRRGPGRPPQREQVTAQIQRALGALLEDSSFADLTVDDIARAAGLKRSGFYFYFRDRRELLHAATEDVAGALYSEADRWWHGEGDPEALVHQALVGVASVYRDHAALLRAVAEVSGYEDRTRQMWRSLIERFVAATTQYLEAEQAAGRLQHLDPRAASESLVWMTERCLYIYLSRGERSVDEVVEMLSATWVAALRL